MRRLGLCDPTEDTVVHQQVMSKSTLSNARYKCCVAPGMCDRPMFLIRWFRPTTTQRSRPRHGHGHGHGPRHGTVVSAQPRLRLSRFGPHFHLQPRVETTFVKGWFVSTGSQCHGNVNGNAIWQCQCQCHGNAMAMMAMPMPWAWRQWQCMK